MRYAGSEAQQPRKVRVPGREQIATVIQEGVNIGTDPAIYCVAVHFEETGEVAYYDKSRVRTVE